MAFATKSSDSFNRANATLHGSTLDNAAGGSESGNTWTVVAGTWDVVSNQGQHSGTDDTVMVVSSTGAVADQRVTFTYLSTTSNATGAIARWAAGGGGNGNFYLAYVDSGNVVQLYKYTHGSGFTQLGSNGGTPNNGDEISVECVGTSISALINGVATVGPITDSAHATGKPGMYRGEGTKVFEDFLYETDEGGGGGTWGMLLGGHNNRLVRS